MMEKFYLKRLIQCSKCPWRKDVDPFNIPNGYTPEKHQALIETIAQKNPIEQLLEDSEKPLPIMACHETHDAHCIGFIHNQINRNNIRLRMHLMFCENAEEIEIVGEQHETFEDTLPG